MAYSNAFKEFSEKSVGIKIFIDVCKVNEILTTFL
jgi:hypothetical protein